MLIVQHKLKLYAPFTFIFARINNSNLQKKFTDLGGDRDESLTRTTIIRAQDYQPMPHVLLEEMY